MFLSVCVFSVCVLSSFYFKSWFGYFLKRERKKDLKLCGWGGGEDLDIVGRTGNADQSMFYKYHPE